MNTSIMKSALPINTDWESTEKYVEKLQQRIYHTAKTFKNKLRFSAIRVEKNDFEYRSIKRGVEHTLTHRNFLAHVGVFQQEKGFSA